MSAWSQMLPIVTPVAWLAVTFFGTRSCIGGEPPQPRNVLTNSIGMKLALVPAGEFRMGTPLSRKGGRDNIQHEVRITRPFYLGICEVTQAEYENVLGTIPSAFRSVEGQDTQRFPVEMVTWEDAVRFCQQLTARPAEQQAGRQYRLPTEAEWEYACRAGTNTVFGCGDSLSSTQANFDGFLPYGGAPRGPNLQRPTTVASFRPNAFGLYDMHGNVYEWCADNYVRDYYQNSPVDDPQGPHGGNLRVLRGGGWNGIAGMCRSADRYYDTQTRCYNDYGLRVAMTVD